MARWLHTNGEVEILRPHRTDRAWTLDELQAAVGGDIEVMPAVTPRMILNEVGRIAGMPHNAAATAFLHQVMAEALGVTPADLPGEVGKRLRYLPELYGDVLILDADERL